jgi:predicted ATP-grasp superfamily ATP-dependent carboligase
MRVGVSTEPDREVERLTRQLLDPVHYRGYFSLEFKKDPRDGQLMLMENNCRLIRYNLLATASGVNHPWIIYQDLVKNKQIDVANYQVGKYWIELYPDLSYSLFQRNKEDIRLRDYIAPYLGRHKVFAELDFHDLKPFFKITKRRVIDFFHKLLKALNLEKERMVLEKSS